MIEYFKAILFITLVSGASFGADATFSVSVLPSRAQEISLRFETVARHPSRCQLSNVRLELKLPPVSPAGIPIDGEGLISLRAVVPPRTPCLPAFGPHSGSLVLNRGFSLPALANGNYRIKINGESCGTLLVRPDSVTLEAP